MTTPETFDYKGYQGSVEFSQADGVFNGKLLAIDDLVTYEGVSREALEQAFREAVEDYLITLEDFE